MTPRQFTPAPDDQVRDPRYAVPVSRHGADRGAVAREADPVLVEDPHLDGGVIEALRVRSGLARMLKAGDITDGMFRVGARFQWHFDVAGYAQVTTVNLEGARGGSGGPEERLHKTIRSREFVAAMLKVSGWPDTQAGKAAWWVVGHGMGLEELAGRKDLHALKGAADSRYWKGAVVTALQMMEAHQKGPEKKRAETCGQRWFSPDELVIVPRR